MAKVVWEEIKLDGQTVRVASDSLVWGLYSQTRELPHPHEAGAVVLRPGRSFILSCFAARICHRKAVQTDDGIVSGFETKCSFKTHLRLDISNRMRQQQLLDLQGHGVEIYGQNPKKLPPCQTDVNWTLEWREANLIIHQIGLGNKSQAEWLITLRSMALAEAFRQVA